MTWKDSFQAALVEVDPTKLLALIHQAETAMTARSESLPTISKEELLWALLPPASGFFNLTVERQGTANDVGLNCVQNGAHKMLTVRNDEWRGVGEAAVPAHYRDF